jgi:hypothetical protein
MTFTYTPFTADRDRLRFHIGDTDANAPIFQDEELDALMVEFGGWQGAVIAALERILSMMAQPNFRADWLQVDHEAARRSYEIVLKTKRKAFGMAAVTVGAVHPQRVDE